MMIDVDILLDKAFECFNHKEFDEAGVLARQVLSIQPTHGDALYLLGLIALQKNIPTQACDYMMIATSLYPKQQVYQMVLADAFMQLKDFESAKKIYQTLPDSDEKKLKIAWLEKGKGNIEQALKLFNNLLKTPQKSEALYALSFFKNGQGKLKFLKESFKLYPCEKIAKEILQILIEQQKKKELLEYISYVSDEFLLAQADLVLEHREQAQKRLEALLKKQPYYGQAWILLGQIQMEKQEELAEFSFNQALILDKNAYLAHKYLARLMMKQNRFSEALDHYQMICRIDPQDKEVLFAMALLAEKTHNYSESLGLYFRLLTLGVKNLNTAIKKNIQLLAETDKKLALDFLKGWQKSYPKNKIAQKMKLVLAFLTLLLPLNSLADLVQEDENWQLLWESKMAEIGDVDSQFYVADLFEQGKKVPKDLIKAVQYYEKAAYQGYLPAALRLGGIFANEKNGALYNEEKSLKWFQFAAKKGDIQAQYYLADFYQNEKHLDLSQAKEYLEKALKQTFPTETDLSKVSPQYATLLEKTNRKNDAYIERKIK